MIDRNWLPELKGLRVKNITASDEDGSDVIHISFDDADMTMLTLSVEDGGLRADVATFEIIAKRSAPGMNHDAE